MGAPLEIGERSSLERKFDARREVGHQEALLKLIGRFVEEHRAGIGAEPEFPGFLF